MREIFSKILFFSQFFNNFSLKIFSKNFPSFRNRGRNRERKCIKISPKIIFFGDYKREYLNPKHKSASLIFDQRQTPLHIWSINLFIFDNINFLPFFLIPFSSLLLSHCWFLFSKLFYGLFYHTMKTVSLTVIIQSKN